MSFQRTISSSFIRTPGAKLSAKSINPVSSSGIPSIDSLLGGGICIGSVVLMEEDQTGSYAEIIFKYFLSEGISSEQGLFVASMKNVDNLMKELPGMAAKEPDDADEQPEQRMAHSSAAPPDLKIAWQYQNLPEVQSCTSSVSSRFDLSRCMEADMVERSKPKIMGINDFKTDRCFYTQLLRQLQASMDNETNSIQRVAFLSMGTALWDCANNMNFCKFLYHLRALMRSSNATCLLTVSTSLLNEKMSVKRMEKLCDTVIRLESFAGSAKETNPVYKDYQGLFYLVKIPTLNALTVYRPFSTEFAFKLRRRKFTVEILHLPPELPETTNRRQEEMDVRSAGFGCGQTRGGLKISF